MSANAPSQNTSSSGREEVDQIFIGDCVSLYYDVGTVTGYAGCLTSLQPKLVLDEKTQADPDVQNYAMYTFELLVQRRYRNIKNFRQALKDQKIEWEARDGVTDPDLLRLKRLAEAEEEDNKLEQRRMTGKPLYYGQIVELRNVFNGMLVAVSSKETAINDTTNMRIVLDEQSSKDSTFIILPRFRVRSEGDVVRSHDQVIFESVSRPGNYVHCGGNRFDPSFVEGSKFEIDLSVNKSAFAIAPYGLNASLHVAGRIQSGDFVRLFHNETDCYLTSEAPLDGDPIEEVHFRYRPDMKKGSRTPLPTASIHVWQIETIDSMKGGPFSWGGLCRFRHVISRRFLAVKDGKLILTRHHADPDCVFTVTAEFQRSIFMTYDSFVNIQHAKSGLWLHALEEPYSRKQYEKLDRKKKVISTMAWDKSKLYQVGCYPKSLDNDVFVISKVKQAEIRAFNFTAGAMPTLRYFSSKYKEGTQVQSHDALMFKAALRTVEKFQFSQGEPIKVHQKLLRHLGFIEVMVAILHAVKSQLIQGQKKTPAGTVSRAIYSLLKSYLSGKSLKNAVYIARHVDLFQEQVEFGVNAADMLLEFFRDNSRILNRITEKRMDQFIDLLKHEKVPRYLDFLGTLCVCKNEAIPRNQNYITKRLLVERKNDRLVYLTDPADGKRPGERIILVTLDSDKERYDMVDFVKMKKLHDKDDEEDQEQRIDYLKGQLRLFGYLCHGRNYYAIDKLTGELAYLSWEEVSLCAGNEKLPYDLRAIYCDLILNLFVNIDPNINALETVDLTYDYAKLTDEVDESSNDDRLASTGARMDYFPELMDWMHRILHASPSQTAENIDKNMFIAAVLRIARYCLMYGYYSNVKNLQNLLAPVISLLNGQFDSPRETCTETERLEWASDERYEQSEANTAIVRAKIEGLKIVELAMNFCMEQRISLFILKFKRTKGAYCLRKLGLLPAMSEEMRSVGSIASDVAMMDELFETTFYYDPNRDLVSVLLDLSNYDNQELVATAMGLIHRYYNAHNEVVQNIVQAQILIVPEAVQVHSRVMSLVPKFRAAITSDIDLESIDVLMACLKEFTKYCSLTQDEDMLSAELWEPHRCNQWTLFNAGIYDDVMFLLEKEVDATSELGPPFHKLLYTALIFFKALSMGFSDVQVKLNDDLERIFELEGIEAGLGLLVAEVFNGNKDLCMNVKELYIRRSVELLASSGRPELFQGLSAIIKVEEINLPLKRNQSLIMKFISLHRNKVLKYVEPSERPDRKILLETAPEGDDRLTYFLSMVDVLATCAEGENRFIESICQNIFSLKEDLFAVINNKEIVITRKFPFIRYLVWVYLNTSAGAVESGVATINKKDYMWSTISLVTEYLRQMIAGTQNMSGSVLRSRFKSEVLTILCEAVFPLLNVFYGDYYDEAVQTGEQKKLSLELSRILVDFLAIGDKIVKDVIQFGILKQAAMTLTTKVSGSESELDRVSSILERRAKSHHSIVTDNRRKYIKDYANQEEMNDILNTWVVNVGEEYKHMDGYAENEADDEGDRFDSDLPRGKEFLDHMCLFLEFQDRHNRPIAHGKVRPIVRVTEYAEKLVTQLIVSLQRVSSLNHADKRRLDELNLKSIKLMRNMIRHQNRRLDGLNRADDPDTYDSIVESVYQIQNELDSYGATLAVVRMLAYPDEDVGKECLKLLIELLAGDNAQTQATMQKYFEDTREDIFFQTCNSCIERTIGALKERKILLGQIMKLKAKKSSLASTFKLSTTRGDPKMHEAIHSDEEPMVEEEEDFLDQLDFSFKDEPGSKLALRAIENLCGGEQRFNQNYLRVQADNNTSTNLISSCLKYLLNLYSSIDDQTVLLVIEVLTTLTETVIGNPDNQALLLDEKLMDPVNHILRTSKFSGVKSRVTARLKLEIAKLLLSIVEYNNDRTKNFAKEIITTLDLKAVHVNMNYYFYENERLQSRPPNKRYDALNVGTTFYLLLRRLSDFSPKELRHDYVFGSTKVNSAFKPIVRKEVNPLKNLFYTIRDSIKAKPKQEKEVSSSKVNIEDRNMEHASNSKYDYFRRRVESVEIARDGGIHRMHFPVASKSALREGVKDHLKWNIDRFHGPAEKIRDFVMRSRCIISDMEGMEKLMKNKYLRPIIQYGYQWRRFMMLFTILLNIIMCVAYDANPSVFEYEPIKRDWFHPVFYTFGAFHLLFTCLVVLEYYLTGTRKANEDDLVKKGDETKYEKVVGFISEWSPSGATVYHTLLLVMSILGLYYHGYCYSFHLLYFAKDNPILDNVFVAITSSGSSLMWVATLALIVIYIFALLAFALYRHSFDSRAGLRCEYLGECFVTVMSFGLRGDLADTIPAFSYGWTELAWRTIYDISFWVLITVVGLNLVFTVIVGTFARLREERAIIAQDLRDTCIICSLSSYDFERFAKGFFHHTTFEHNIYDYIWLMIHLRQKDPTDYSSHENYVADMLRQNDFNFFPINQALSLSNRDGDSIEEKMKNVEEKVSRLVRHYKRMELAEYREEESKSIQQAKEKILRA